MALVIVGARIVLPDIVVVDGGAKEELPDIVERLGIGIGHSIVAPTRGALHKRHVQAVVARVRRGRVLTVVCVSRIGTATIVAAYGNATWNVLIDGDDEVYAAQVLVADR